MAGSAVKWVRDSLGLISDAKEIGELAGQVKDSGGVYFVTAFSGLFCPYWDDTATGTIVVSCKQWELGFESSYFQILRIGLSYGFSFFHSSSSGIDWIHRQEALCSCHFGIGLFPNQSHLGRYGER